MEWYIIITLTSVQFESYIHTIVKTDHANFCAYACLSRFIIITKLFILHLISLSIAHSSLLDILHLGALHTALKWFTRLHSPHIMPYPGHLLGGWLDPQYLHVPILIISALACPALALVCPAPLNCIMCISSCFVSIKTCSLVILSVLLLISFIIFAFIHSLSRPHMNCSFIHLSCS